MGRIFDIQRFALHDGPGIRTTVFLKGCPLRCLWCGNPESISLEPVLSYTEPRCIACGDCVPACTTAALSQAGAGRAALNRARCTRCGACVERCVPKALENVGRETTDDDVLRFVLRDRESYRASGGGLTLSGGEPLVQAEFAESLLHAAKVEGLHTAVETSGYGPYDAIERLQPLVDLWLYDYKETDPQRHAKYTGVWNTQILANLERLHAAGARLLLRCPMIPDHNARREHLDGIVALARRLLRLEGVELLPYYDLWRAKLPRFGLTSSLPTTVRAPDRATVASWSDYLRQRGVRVVN